MGVARSTIYDELPAATDDVAIVETMSRVCEEFERYGWRRIRAALRQQGLVVNHKKIRRLMCEIASNSNPLRGGFRVRL